MNENFKGEPLSEDFFQGKTLSLCRSLLGMHLCRRNADESVTRLPITELEAYDGFRDKASHAHREKTPRNAGMFEAGGRWYVYLCYGVHWLLNITVGPSEHPAAILVRGAGSIQGPGRLTRQLGVDGKWDGKTISPEESLWIEASPEKIASREIIRTPRIGIDSAGPVWSQKPWRFVWKDAPFAKVKV